MKSAIARSGSRDVAGGPIGDCVVVEDGRACEMGVRQVFVAGTGDLESAIGVEGGIGIGGRVASPMIPPPVQLTGPLALIVRGLSPLPSVPPLQAKRELMVRVLEALPEQTREPPVRVKFWRATLMLRRIAPERGGVDDRVVGGAGGGAVVGDAGF